MSKLDPPTQLEKISGNVVTESALSIVALLAGGPVAPLLPILAKSLASNRQKQRVESCLQGINEVLIAQGAAIQNLSDPQYKLINETVLTALHTTSIEKLTYLRQAVQNTLNFEALGDEEAVLLSRIIRDISAEEADFLIRNFQNQRIQLGALQENNPHALVIASEGKDELVLAGLISLGLVIPAGPTIDDSGLMRFSSIVSKVIVLLKGPTQKNY